MKYRKCFYGHCPVLLIGNSLKGNNTKTSTGLYRSCAALAYLSGTFDLILFEAVDFEFIVKKVWFGEVCFVLVDGLDQPCFALV